MGKYDIRKTKKLKFARIGGLSSVNQKGYAADGGSHHSPPATRGFYCFVWPYYEPFLLGGSWTAWPWVANSKFSYIRGKDGNIITDKHPEYETYESPNKVFQVPTKNWNKNADARPGWDDKVTDEERDRIDAEMDKDWEDNHKDEPRWMYAIQPKPKIFEYEGEIWSHLEKRFKPHQILARHGDWVKTSTSDYKVALNKEAHGAYVEYAKMGFYLSHRPTTKSPFRNHCKDDLEVFIEKI